MQIDGGRRRPPFPLPSSLQICLNRALEDLSQLLKCHSRRQMLQSQQRASFTEKDLFFELGALHTRRCQLGKPYFALKRVVSPENAKVDFGLFLGIDYGRLDVEVVQLGILIEDVWSLLYLILKVVYKSLPGHNRSLIYFSQLGCHALKGGTRRTYLQKGKVRRRH